MSDPTEITQGQEAGIIATVIGAITLFAGAFAKLWATIFGSRKERTDATERAAEIALRAAEHADERAERADEETASHKMALGTCEEQLRAMRAEIRLMRADLNALRAENAALRRQTAWQQRAINRLLAGSTPPDGIHPDDVRDEMARLEDTQ